jgi:NADPH2:quinone reductase
MYSQYRVVAAEQCLGCPTAPRRPKAPRASSTRSSRSAWSRRCARRPQGAGAHGGGLQPRPDAERICQKDGVDLVNIVRKPEQVALLRGLGAKYVCDASSPTFLDDLTEALVDTGATLAFDATGGGKLAGRSSAAWKPR